jgi:hypothetical protein
MNLDRILGKEHTPSMLKCKQKIFGAKFSPNTLIFVDPFLLIFLDRGVYIKKMLSIKIKS